MDKSINTNNIEKHHPKTKPNLFKTLFLSILIYILFLLFFLYNLLSFGSFGGDRLGKEQSVKITLTNIKFDKNNGIYNPINKVQSKLGETGNLTKPEQAAIQKELLTLKKYMTNDKNELQIIEKEIAKIDQYLEMQPKYIAKTNPNELKKHKLAHIRIVLKHLKYKNRKKTVKYLKSLKLEKLADYVYILGAGDDYMIQEKEFLKLQQRINSLNY